MDKYSVNYCERVFTEFTNYNHHLNDNHFKDRIIYDCPFELEDGRSCPSGYQSKTSFFRHLRANHQFQINYDLNNKPISFKTIDHNLIRAGINQMEDNNQPLSYPPLNEFENLNIRDNFNLDADIENLMSSNQPVLERPIEIRNLSDNQKFVINLSKCKFENRITHSATSSLAKTVLFDIKSSFINRTLDESKLNNYISLSSSVYRQKLLLDEVLDFNDMIHQHTFADGGEFQFIDLRRSLKLYLNNPEIMRSIWIERQTVCNPQIINSFRSSGLFQEDDEKTINLYLQIYFDDFNTSRNRSIHTKLSVVYLTLSNLPYSKQSKRDQILLSLICKRSNLKRRENLIEFFKPLIDSINQINTDPIRLTDGFKVKVKLSSVVGDNLATNELQNISRSFRWDACKWCKIFLDQIRPFNLVRMMANVRGLGNEHIFAGVDFQGSLYSPDIFHDLFEGIIPVIVNAILKKMNLENRETIEKECNTKFKKSFKNGLVYNIKDCNISGTGIQKYDFFIMLSILNRFISKSSQIWKLYLLLRKIVSLCLSTSIFEIDLAEFENDCLKFNTAFSTIFSSINTPFKVHHLIHYAALIRSFGPLFFLSTLRYERVHQLLNRSVKGSLNFNTLPKQIAKNWVISNLIQNQQPNSDHEDILTTYEPDELNQHVSSDFSPFINAEQQLIILNSATINDLSFESNDIFLYKYSTSDQNPLPLFIVVTNIIKQNNNIKILGKVINCEQYFQSICCFKVNQHQQIIEIDPKIIKSHKKLQVINSSLGFLIQNQIYIPYELLEKYNREISFDQIVRENLEVVFENDAIEYDDEDEFAYDIQLD